jgi:hypothetical protein
MRLVPFGEDQPAQSMGAAVVRAAPDGGVIVEFGPADGAPIIVLEMTRTEALQMSDMIRAVANGGSEGIILAAE